jgi:hypothetical protein
MKNESKVIDKRTEEKINKDLGIDEKYDVKTLDSVLDIDFSKDEQELDIETAYDFIDTSKQNKKETKESVEKQEADNIIEEYSNQFLDKEFEENYNKEYDNLRNFLKRYKINGDLVKNMSEEDKNKIYGIAEYLFNEYQLKLNHLMFKFYLTNEEKKFLLDLLRNKIEYDQNEVFQMKELMDRYINILDETKTTKEGDENLVKTMINVNDVIILYHLVSKYKVKGVNSNFYNYLSLLTKIGERIKLFNAYNVWVQRLSDDFQLWGSSLTVDEEMIVSAEVEKQKDVKEVK